MAFAMGIVGSMLQSCNTKYKVWTDGSAQKIYNLNYGNERKQRMDIYLPYSYSEETPVTILIHGGGWQYGNKRHMVHIQNFLYKNNLPTININYRFISPDKKITYKQQLEDISFAIEKFNELAPKARLKTNQYILLGESAGAHLALLYGYQNPHQVQKIISLSAPVDFYSEHYLNSFYSRYSSVVFQKVVGVPFDRKNLSDEFRKASPIANISNVPTLIFQGDNDILVNKSQGLALDSVLNERNIEHRMILLKNSGHTPRFFSRKKRDSIIYPNILDWIKR